MPLSPSVLLSAITWLRGTLLGSVGITVAIVAVAAVGLLMLRGHMPVRRGAMVVLGCFILFSAEAIADALIGRGSQPFDPAPLPPQQSYTPTTARPVPYDPYAGASVPNRQLEQPVIK